MVFTETSFHGMDSIHVFWKLLFAVLAKFFRAVIQRLFSHIHEIRRENGNRYARNYRRKTEINRVSLERVIK